MMLGCWGVCLTSAPHPVASTAAASTAATASSWRTCFLLPELLILAFLARHQDSVRYHQLSRVLAQDCIARRGQFPNLQVKLPREFRFQEVGCIR